MSECMYQQNTSPKGCYYENKDHSVIFIECDTADCYYKQLKRLEQELKEKDNFLKWLITQQYYIIPKNLKQKIKEILKDV